MDARLRTGLSKGRPEGRRLRTGYRAPLQCASRLPSLAGGRRLDRGGQAERLAQLRPAGLVIVRPQEAVEVDRGILGLLPLAQMHLGLQGCAASDSRPSPRPGQRPADRVGHRIHSSAERIAQRRGTVIGPLHKGAGGDPQTNRVWPKSPLCFGSPPGVATSTRPPRPKIELNTKRCSVTAAAPKRPCRMSLPKMRGSFRLSSRSRKRLSTGAGVAALTTLATGSSTTWFARRTPRFVCSQGSSIGSDGSRGTPAQALRSAVTSPAVSPATQRSARRIEIDSFRISARHANSARKPNKGPAGKDQLRFLRNQTQPRIRLSEALDGDYHPFATPPTFCAWPGSRSSIGMSFALRRQEGGLEEHGGGERRHERERHQLAHARRARMVRKP